MNLETFKNSLIYLSYFGEPSGTRTRDPLIKSQMLYLPELTAHRKLTRWAVNSCSLCVTLEAPQAATKVAETSAHKIFSIRAPE